MYIYIYIYIYTHERQPQLVPADEEVLRRRDQADLQADFCASCCLYLCLLIYRFCLSCALCVLLCFSCLVGIALLNMCVVCYCVLVMTCLVYRCYGSGRPASRCLLHVFVIMLVYVFAVSVLYVLSCVVRFNSSSLLWQTFKPMSRVASKPCSSRISRMTGLIEASLTSAGGIRSRIAMRA